MIVAFNTILYKLENYFYQLNRKIIYQLVCMAICFTWSIGYSQLVVTSQTPQNLVNNVLLGTGVAASNITFTGNTNQIAYFDGTNSNLGLTEGIILAAEDVNNAIGPNDDAGGFGMGLGNNNGDTDLDQIAGVNNNTFDAAILEFDVIPAGDSVTFNFVFASEEYMEFVNAGVNDAFGLFLSGPGITGPYSNNAINLATIPGTNTNITIDDVNANVNSTYYVDNGDGSFFSPQFNDPTVVQYDGFTVKLKAAAQVQCGQTYHLKIAVADVGDDVYGSAVFLEASSFNANQSIVSSLTSLQDTIPCGGSTDLTAASSGGSTFLLNQGLPNALGTYTVSPPVTTTYQLIIIDSNYCNTVYTDTIEHTIHVAATAPTISANLSLANNTINCGDSTTLTATNIGGYNFSLDNGLPNSPGTYTIKPAVTTTYEFIVYDTNSCGSQITDTATITLTVVGPNPNLSPNLMTTNDTICSGDSTQITASNLDGSAFEFNPGLPNAPGTYWVSPTQPTQYEFIVFDTVCGQVISDTAFLTIYIRDTTPVNGMISLSTDTICESDSSQLTISSDRAKLYVLNGAPVQAGTFWVKPTVTTDYELIVFDTTVCGVVVSDTISTRLVVNPSDSALFIADILSGCTPLTVQFTNLSPNANSSSWKWKFGTLDSSTNLDASYTFNTGGCFDISLESTSPDLCYIPNTKAQYICASQTPVADFDISPNVITVLSPQAQFTNQSSNGINYEWFIDSLLVSTDPSFSYVFPPVEDNYLVTLIALGANGCSDTITDSVNVRATPTIFTPNAFTPSGDRHNELFAPVVSSVASYEFIVFDRWGHVVFESNQPGEGWDGRVKGQAPVSGVYVWKLTYESYIEKGKKTIHGHVVLIK